METIKQEITEYWARRSGQFSSLRTQELHSEKRVQWTEELLRYLPRGKFLDILDVGCGSGFFSVILASMGHHVTGIDLTPEMIKEARKTADSLGLSIDFRVMDAENPDFPDGSFDVILSRNLTWTLPHLKETYIRWKQLLKLEGILLNFDGDYCRENNNEAQLPANHAHRAIDASLNAAYEHLKSELAPAQKPRPAWDRDILAAAGFRNIRIDRDLSRRLYQKADAFYNPTPMFTICAHNQTEVTEHV